MTKQEKLKHERLIRAVCCRMILDAAAYEPWREDAMQAVRDINTDDLFNQAKAEFIKRIDK